MSEVDRPSPEAAVALVREFLHHAADLRDPATARTLMTAASTTIPAFDPRGLAGTQYVIGEPANHEDAVIVPVGFADATGQQATAPLVVVMENGLPRIDVAATVELMMGGQINIVDASDVDDEEL
jgi:hypothetical protein